MTRNNNPYNVVTQMVNAVIKDGAPKAFVTDLLRDGATIASSVTNSRWVWIVGDGGTSLARVEGTIAETVQLFKNTMLDEQSRVYVIRVDDKPEFGADAKGSVARLSKEEIASCLAYRHGIGYPKTAA